MDMNIVIGIVGLALSVGSLIYAVYIRRKSRTEKKLVYEAVQPMPVAEVLRSDSSYSLKVVYEKPGEEPVYIEHAFIQFLRFTNFGQIPITNEDIAKGDPLRIEIEGGRVLDASLLRGTRNVCGIYLRPIEDNNGKSTIPIEFEFFDYLDGGIVQILTDTGKIQASIKGTVIGMPEGIKETQVLTGSSEVSGWGCALGVAFELVALLATALVYRQVVGSWSNAWLLILPVIALILPITLFGILFSLISGRTEFSFPKELIPPRWFQLGSGFYYSPVRKRYLKEKVELLSEIEKLEERLSRK